MLIYGGFDRRSEMRFGVGLILVFSVLLSGTLGFAQIADYWGFSDYPQMVNSQLVEVGFVTGTFPPLTSDPGSFQYTYALEGLVLSNVMPLGPSIVYTFLGGTFSMYEDASFNALYDDGACTVSDPSTFTDGTLYLQASVDTLTWIYSTMTSRGSFDAVMIYDGGTHLGELLPQYEGGTLFGGTTAINVCIPAGYLHRWDGQAFALQNPSATRPDSWGSVKSLYR
jgi:hypothetical protein